MTTSDEITTQVTAQKWLEPFKELMDEIYWPGYAETLAEKDPKTYNREYFYFMAIYS